MRTRDPQAIAVLVFALVAAAVTVLALGRIFGADDAVAATIEAGASRPSGAVTFDGEARVVISEGALPDEIVTILARAGVSSDAETLRTLLHFTGAGGELLAGEYRFALGTPPAEIIRRLRGGPDQIERITFRTGLRVEEIGEILEREGYFSAQEWDAAIEEEPPRDFMGDETDFLGYLMPGTYEIEDRTTAESLLAAMLDRFAEEVPDSLVAEAEEQGWTLYEVVTLASVVEREAVHPEEKAVIAAAFRNRLDEGIALQADATVQYALTLQEDGPASVAEFGWWKRGLTEEDLALDSPYNTYQYPGMIPGPIANVDADSIRGVIRPAAVDYVYFVASPECDGRHLFASTLEEHNANVETFLASGCGEEEEAEE